MIGNRDGRVLLLDGDELVAEARAAPVDLEPPAPVALADAASARSRHVRGADEEFNECYVCGVREDGLEVRVGPVAGREALHAAPVELRESGPEFVWAAIDCAGAYAVGAEGRGDIVLGRMTARVDQVPDVGEECVVVAWPLGEDGRKLFAGTALWSAGGVLMAVARQTWIAPRA
jgi:hypothetical protein